MLNSYIFTKFTFRLRTLDGERITVPMPKAFHTMAGRLGGKERHLLTFSSVATYDSWDKLQKVIEAEAFEVQFNYELATRFEEIRALQDGWFDGLGLAPDAERLDGVAEQFVQAYPEKISLPALVPTPEGDLLLEWDLPGQATVKVLGEGLLETLHDTSENRPGYDGKRVSSYLQRQPGRMQLTRPISPFSPVDSNVCGGG